MKAIMLAHQNCSVSKAMALGQNVAVGLPKLIIKDKSLQEFIVSQKTEPIIKLEIPEYLVV